jgi:hypothetical protein
VETPSHLAMGEPAPPTGVYAGDNSEQEKDIAKAEHHGNAGCLIAATSNEASGEPGGGAWDGAEAARPDRCLQV